VIEVEIKIVNDEYDDVGGAATGMEFGYFRLVAIILLCIQH
jgi:hypothetical protein